MTLKTYQESLTLGNLYKVNAKGAISGSEQLSASLFINSGSVDVYGSNSATAPTVKTQMTLNTNDVNLSGLNRMQIVPTYIYIEQNAGTSTEIISSGIVIDDLGAI